MDGTIVRMVKDKGFGFIKELSTAREYFFHRSAVTSGIFEHMTEGQRVTFDDEPSGKGLRGKNVQLAD